MTFFRLPHLKHVPFAHSKSDDMPSAAVIDCTCRRFLPSVQARQSSQYPFGRCSFKNRATFYATVMVILLVATLAACGDVSNPAAPTPTPPAQPPPVTLFPVTFPFDSWLWQSLVYNAYDDHPGDLSESGRVSLVLATTSPNVYIRRSTPDDTMPGCGLHRWTVDNLAYMERMIPRLIEQLTGERYRGQVVSGCEDRNWAGWITIVSASLQEEPDLAGLCGRARVGTSVGRIWINERTARNSRLKSCLPHELGHAMGFYHAPKGYGYVMAQDSLGAPEDFTIEERQHAQYAYKRGRYAPYCYDAATCLTR